MASHLLGPSAGAGILSLALSLAGFKKQQMYTGENRELNYC